MNYSKKKKFSVFIFNNLAVFFCIEIFKEGLILKFDSKTILVNDIPYI
jgi:hypothetical protein